MNHSLYVQIIRTNWTKKSRGAPLATPRNAVPLALPIYDLREGYLTIAQQVYGEGDAFKNPVIRREQFELVDELHYEHGCFNLDWNGHIATTEYKRSWWASGSPRPKVSAPKIANLELNSDEWAHLRWQGRFSDIDTGSWWYEHICINVSHFDHEPHPNIFRCTKPNRQFIHLPQLR